MMANATHQSCASEDGFSEDSTHCAVSPECISSNSSVGSIDREDEADCGSIITELSTITENDCLPPSFAAFYSEFLRDEAILCNEMANNSSSTSIRGKPPSRPVAQLVFLADLIKGFQRLDFQIELQRLLLVIQACQCNPTGNESVMHKIVTRRDDIELSVYHEIMHKHGFTQQRDPFSGKIPMWEFIAPFSDDADVSKLLSEIDELLALPYNTTRDDVCAWGRAKQ